MDGTHVELKEFVERILDEREKQQSAHFKALEETVRRQVVWIGIAVGSISSIIGVFIGFMLKGG